MPKTKWDGAEEPTIHNFHKIDNSGACFYQKKERLFFVETSAKAKWVRIR